MPSRIGRQYILVLFTALCLVVAGLAGISWKKDARSGSHGTNAIYKISLEGYELDAGDSVYYEYEASEPCCFIITNDWDNPEIGEKLNISGFENSGQFKCTVAGFYILQVLFLELPEEGWATIDYEFYVLDDISRAMQIAKPILLTILTAALISMVSVASMRAHRARPDGDPDATQGYWRYFASRISNWIAIAAGASILVAVSILDLSNLMDVAPRFVGNWLPGIGNMFLIWGLILGVVITYPKYVDDFTAQVRR